MRINLLLGVLTALLSHHFSFSQQLVINEVSQGPSGSKEYVELLVVGTITCNGIPCMDLRNYYIDDNNGNHATGAGVGIAAGCVRFKNIPFWSCIPIGTMILIYNDADPNVLVPATDISMGDNNCRLVIPISDCTLLERHTTQPSTGSAAYPSTGFTNCGNWTQISMANGDDSFQAINSAGGLVHSVSWGNNTLTPVIYFAGSAAGMVAKMNNNADNNPFNQANWTLVSVAGNETPGSPNNAANSNWISSMTNSCSPLLAFSVTASASLAGCTCNGSATVIAAGAVAPYTYTWLPSGGNSNVATGLCAGIYTVFSTSFNGCLQSATVNITSGGSLSVSIANSSISCNGGTNGSATVTAGGGTPAYTYSWIPAGGTSSVASGLAVGSYTAIITDNNGCTITAVANITQPTTLTAAISSTNVSCNGGTNGSATVTAGGGTPAYTYSWMPSGGTSSVANGLGVGSYTAIVTDNNGCTITAVANITQPATLTEVISSTNVSCNGGANGSATVSAGGGTPAYTYSWMPAGGTSSVANGLGVGSYTAIITDNNGCTVTAVANITQPTTLTAAISSTNVTCNGGANGSATVTAGGGTPAYTYSWILAGGTSSVASGLAVGSYTAIITDNNGCTVTAVANITQPTTLTAAISSTNVTCNGGANGSATVTAGGGTPAYTYSWIPAGGTSSVASGLAVGSYTAIITDNNGCTVTAVANITQPTTLTAAISSTNVSCNGGTNGSATVTAGGGTPPYTYSWIPTGGTSSVANGLGVGSYTAIITDNNGCTVSAVANITQPSVLTATTNSTNANCGMANGSATVAAGGGTPSYTYSWMPSGGTSSVALGLLAGTYSVIITDNQNCSISAVININNSSSMTTAITPSNVSCNGGINGSATVTVGGGTPAYTYSWMPAGGTSSVAIGLGAGSYTVTITDNQSCITTAVVNITQPTVLTAAISSSNVSCNAGTNGSALVIAGGGTPAYTYTWIPAGGTSSVASGLGVGSYSAIVIDNNGCTVTAAANITQPSVLTAVISSSNVSCNGATNGSVAVTASGGTPGYTYTWTPNGNNSAVLNNITAGNYSVSIKDANNCTISAVSLITQPAFSLSAAVSNTNVLCFGNATGVASVNTNGGTSPYSYSWSPGAMSGALVNNLTPGNYTVMVTDANNCIKTVTVNITQPPTITVNVNPLKLCKGQNGSLAGSVSGGVSPFNYFWNNNPGSSTFSVSSTASAIYTLYVTDANGCNSPVDTALVNIGSPLSLSVSPSTTICADKVNTLSASASGGLGNYQYTWLPGNIHGQTISIKISNTTIYTVMVSDGCTQPNAQQTTTIYTESVGGSTILASKYSGCAPLCVTFTNSSFTNDQNIQTSFWTFSDTTSSTSPQPTHCFNTPGTYTAYNFFTTKLGCTGAGTLNNEITVYQKPTADFIASVYTVSIFNPLVNFNNQSFNATNYFWDFAGKAESTQFNSFHNFTETGKYLVTLVAYNGECSDTAFKVIECLPEFTFYAPNTFTPNDDNLNDRFLPKGEGWEVETYNLMVFDRWGEQIFITNQYDEGWNGKYKSELVKNDVYVWKVTLKDIFNKQHEFVGTIMVMK